MDVRIDGLRANDEGWRLASNVPTDALPQLGPGAEEEAALHGMSLRSYAEYMYAAEFTTKELQQRAGKLGVYVQRWLQKHGIDGSVDVVSLTTLQGKYRISVKIGGHRTSILTDEDLIDDMFERGSAQAERDFRRVLRLNLMTFETAKAS